MTVATLDWLGLAIAGGRYQVLHQLGHGGMASVYLAVDTKLSSKVVIKAAHSAFLKKPDFVARFRREIRSLGQLNHPNILKAFDVGEHRGVPFAVLQYLAGGSLRERQARDAYGRPQPLPPESMLFWLLPVAAALDYIHSLGYIHRDVKPDNILFDEHGHAYLGDFGVAKVVNDHEANSGLAMTRDGQTIGTPQYMSPELILAKNFDHRADQYALAVTLYELLCGRYPFDGPNPTAIFLEQTQKSITPLDRLVHGLPPGLSDVVLRGSIEGSDGPV